MTRRRPRRGSIRLGLGAAVAGLLVLSTAAAVREIDHPIDDDPTLAQPGTVLTADAPHVVSHPARLADRPAAPAVQVDPLTIDAVPPAPSPPPAPASPPTTPPVLAESPSRTIERLQPPEPVAPAPPAEPVVTEPSVADSPTAPAPPAPPVVAAAVTLDPGTPVAVVAVALSAEEPEADLTVADMTIVGDAPPADSTSASIGGTLLSEEHSLSVDEATEDSPPSTSVTDGIASSSTGASSLSAASEAPPADPGLPVQSSPQVPTPPSVLTD